MSASAPRLPVRVAAASVVALWIPYTLLNVIFPGPIVTYICGLALAVIALGLLWLAGIPPRCCFVRAGLASRQGAMVLLALSIYVPVALVAVGGHPWNWIAILIYAPASAIAQELYFRAALLSSLIQFNPKRPAVAVLLQALLFALWHARAFEVVSIAPALAVLAGVFIPGVLWGWQARHDRTVIYAAVEHTLFLAIV